MAKRFSRSSSLPPPDSGLLLRSAVFVFVAGDVVFIECVAELDFDDNERGVAGIAQAVFRSLGNFDGLVTGQSMGCFVNLNLSGACNNGPVFASVMMKLQRELLARIYHKFLD